MKPFAIALASTLLIPSLPVMADSQPGYSTQRTCYKQVYREEYVPGTQDRPGRIDSWFEEAEVPCTRGGRTWRNPTNSTGPGPVIEEENSCIEGSILGGIAGGAIGAAASRDDGMIWAIPTGVVGGALLGCQIDGG